MADALSFSGIVDDAEDEDRRLRSLRRTGLLDSPREELFDRYVRVAAALADVPMSMISLVDEARQWFKAAEGLEKRETPRAWAFCDHAIRERGLFEVGDASQDARFCANPLVTGEPAIRFYAGAPIVIDEDQAIGTLCVVDRSPRTLTGRQRGALTDLAKILAREIETNHLAEIRADRAAAARAAAIEIEHQMRNMFSKVGAIIDMSIRDGGDVASVADIARRRVLALSQANEVCLANDFAGAPLRDLAKAALRPLRARTGVTVGLAGEALWVSPAAASVLAPIVDELAADAARRGAISEDAPGELDWRVEEREVVFSWTEAAGSFAANDAAAFSSEFLRETGPSALRGTVTLEEKEGRRRYVLRVPHALIRKDA